VPPTRVERSCEEGGSMMAGTAAEVRATVREDRAPTRLLLAWIPMNPTAPNISP